MIITSENCLFADRTSNCLKFRSNFIVYWLAIKKKKNDHEKPIQISFGFVYFSNAPTIVVVGERVVSLGRLFRLSPSSTVGRLFVDNILDSEDGFGFLILFARILPGVRLEDDPETVPPCSQRAIIHFINIFQN